MLGEHRLHPAYNDREEDARQDHVDHQAQALRRVEGVDIAVTDARKRGEGGLPCIITSGRANPQDIFLALCAAKFVA